MSDDLTTLRQRLAEVSDLNRSAGVLGWDQRVTMPPKGTEARAEALATLGRIAHDRFTDPESDGCSTGSPHSRSRCRTTRTTRA